MRRLRLLTFLQQGGVGSLEDKDDVLEGPGPERGEREELEVVRIELVLGVRLLEQFVRLCPFLALERCPAGRECVVNELGHEGIVAQSA